MSNRRDVLLIKEFALPATAGAAVSEAFKLSEFVTPNDIRDEHYQFEVKIPAITEAELPEGSTLTVEIQSSDTEDFSEFVSVVFVTLDEPTNVTRFAAKPSEKALPYWRAKITTAGESVGDMSGLTAEFTIVF